MTARKRCNNLLSLMEHVENQLDWLEEKPKKKQETARIAPLRRIHTIADLSTCDFAKPPPFTVIRVNPTTVMVLKDGFGL